jgi:hypothetical protein
MLAFSSGGVLDAGVMKHALGRVFTPGLQFDNAEKRVLRPLRSIRASPWAARLSRFELVLPPALIALLTVGRS